MPKGPVGFGKCHQFWLLGSLLADSQEAHRNPVTRNTCPICVSKSLEKLHFSAQERPLTALGRRVLVSLEVCGASRRFGAAFGPVAPRSAVAGRTCPCPLPRRLPRAATLPANIIITINIIVAITITITIIIILNQDHCYSAAPTPRLFIL